MNIAFTGAVDALAAAICGRRGACQDCRDKAETIMNETVEMPYTV